LKTLLNPGFMHNENLWRATTTTTTTTRRRLEREMLNWMEY